MDATLILGIVGAGLILLAFILNQFEVWKGTDLSYDLVNLVGGTILVVYGVLTEAWPFVILNVVWSIVSLKDVIQYVLHGKRTKQQAKPKRFTG